MRYLGRLVAATVGLVAFGTFALTASAAVPGNDTFPNATTVSAGYSAVLDTTEATTDADDAQLNGSCGAPATDASVWYSIAGADQLITVNVSGSNYSAGVIVGVGTQGNLQTVSCGPGSVAFFAATGTTYYLLAIDAQTDGSGNGGSLSISITNPPPPPSASVTVNSTGKVDSRKGIATISGTYTCSNADSIDISGTGSEPVGRFSVLGSFEFFEIGKCDGTAHTWSADVRPSNGKFAGGKLAISGEFSACATYSCATGTFQQKVQLKGK